MRRIFVFMVLAASLVVFMATSAPAVFINFDNGTNGSTIGNFYGGIGITFSNAQWDDFVSIDEESVNAGGLKLIDIGSNYQPQVNNPVVGIFGLPVSFISIRGLNVGANRGPD